LALHHAVIAFTSPQRALVTAEPGYEGASKAAEFIGSKVVRVPLRADGSHDLPAMLAAAKTQPVGLFYVCNPNNPTGTVTPRAQIEALIAGKPLDSFVLLDEAYIHFCDEPPGSIWCERARMWSCCARFRRSTAWPACAPASRSLAMSCSSA
jgi:histidinol-phosphate aminotransferase